jgi:catechol 2,3-dioxygenase-like lactoylglutathione lyase family enzyme/predicted enzyme related to lactoylglutathione lyase
MRTLAAWLTAALFAVVAMFAQPAAPDGPVVGVGPFLHIVSDLDQSLAFYHDTLGLELAGPAGEHKFTDNPAVANLYGVPGKQFRAAVLKIPGTPMGIELVQWGEARKPKGEPMTGPGVATLVLRRSDGPKSQRDPDGFPVELEQSENPGADLTVSVSDIGKTTALYGRLLGLKEDRIRFNKIKAGDAPVAPFPAAGQGMLRVFVRDIDALTASFKNAGFSVITTGGAPVTLPQGQRVIIFRDPNNFYLQLMETR